MTKTEAIAIAGTLSEPSKMPSYSYGLPAAECITGAKLVNVKGSVCEGCYALKGFYSLYAKTILPAQYKRLEAIKDERWVDAMVTLISGGKKAPFSVFRWHDSGDLQSVEHLTKIAIVADRLPKVKFWLPTREYGIVNAFLKLRSCPRNLVIRLSAHMVGQSMKFASGMPTSSVFVDKAPKGAYECPARFQGNACGNCRACWDPGVKEVSYHKH